MLTKKLSEEFNLFLERYLAFYKDFLKVEQEKYEIILAEKIDKLDAIVVREQALMLQSRGFEVQRDNLIKTEIADNVTLRELVPLVDESVRGKVELLYNELCEVILEFKNVNNSSNSLVELRLHKIDTNISRLENNKTTKDYNNTARVPAAPSKMSGIISRKI